MLMFLTFLQHTERYTIQEVIAHPWLQDMKDNERNQELSCINATNFSRADATIQWCIIKLDLNEEATSKKSEYSYFRAYQVWKWVENSMSVDGVAPETKDNTAKLSEYKGLFKTNKASDNFVRYCKNVGIAVGEAGVLPLFLPEVFFTIFWYKLSEADLPKIIQFLESSFPHMDPPVHLLAEPSNELLPPTILRLTQ